MLPSGLWRSLGADTDQLTAILNMRLMLDNRRPMGFGRRQAQKKDIKNGTLINTFMFGIMGVLYGIPVYLISDRVLSMVIYFTLIFLMITLTLITDFSNALFDNRDKYTLFPRPINDRTLVLAKLLHVFIYLLRIVLPMALPAWIAIGYLDGWASAVLFPLPVLLLVFMSLFAVNSVYLIILRLVKPEKFKDVISYFQVIASIVFFATVYLHPRKMFEMDPSNMFDASHFQWVKYIPTYWLAACWSWIGVPLTFGGGIFMSLLAIVAPLLCVIILVKYLAPEFSRKISGIDSAEVSHEITVIKNGKAAKPGKLYLKLANIFNRSDAAKAGFILAWLQTSRSRTFRMRVYPALAFVPIYFIYLLTQNGSSISEAYATLPGSSKFILLLYMSAYVLINALNYLIMSEQYKAAWVFYSSPVETPGNIMIGAFKALCVKLFLPFFTAISIFTLWIWGPKVIPDIFLSLVNVLLLATCIARISFRQLPFSSMEQIKQSGGKVIRSIITMLIPFVLGVGHYLSVHIWWLKLTFIFLSGALLWLIWDSYAGTNWGNIRKEDA